MAPQLRTMAEAQHCHFEAWECGLAPEEEERATNWAPIFATHMVHSPQSSPIKYMLSFRPTLQIRKLKQRDEMLSQGQ